MHLPFPKENPLFYSGDTLHRIKQNKVQELLTKYEFEGLLFFKPEAVRYITDFYIKGYRPFWEPEYLTFIAKNQKPVVGYTSGSDTCRIQLRSDIDDYRKLPDIALWSKEIIKILKDYGVTSGKIGTDFLPFFLHDTLLQEFPNIEFIPANSIWVDLTTVKHPLEIEILQQAISITESGINAALSFIRDGVKEYETAAWAEYIMRKNGSEMTPFLTNVASGVNSAIFERLATDKIIRPGEMIIIDLGCVWKGYTGDLGRTTCIGTPTTEQKSIYRATHLALQEAIKAVKPGVSCSSIDSVSRQVIAEEGYEKYQHTFATGHQLGYGLHGNPKINQTTNDLLQEGMVIALEPRITLFDRPNVGGAHLEDVVLVTKTGHKRLSTLGYDENLLKG